jgi:hypothetical protein
VLEVAARGARRAVADADRGLGAASSRLHLARAREGAWVGASLVGADDGDGRGLPLAGGGAWMQRGRFTISVQVVRLLRSMRLSRLIAAATGPGDSSSGGVTEEHVLRGEVETHPLTGAETAVAWSVERFDVQSRAGISIAERERPARWGELRAAFWTRGDLAVFVRAASGMSVAPSPDRPRGTEAALGIQFVPGRGAARAPAASTRDAPALRIEPLGEGRHRILIDAVAREVEVCSDATGWSPVPAQRIAGDTWEVMLDLAPGVHRIAMRCDGGAWRPPPGLPSTKDEFGGRVGLVVVE